MYGECNGALVIDDYAHHPTELRATLNTAKEMGYKRLIAVHQPDVYKRQASGFPYVEVKSFQNVSTPP